MSSVQSEAQSTSIIRRVVRWFGIHGLILLVLVLVGVGYGLMWERNRHPPLPPGATAAVVSTAPDLRQTAYDYPGSTDQLRAFYAEAMSARGWQRCGDGSTPGCSNLPQLVDRDPTTIEVYRRADDQNGTGPTVEIWPIPRDASLYVTVFETRGS